MCCHQISETAEFLPVASITRWICSSGSSRVAQPPPPLNFRPNWGPKSRKKNFETVPPLLRVWMKAPRYLKVWIRLWFVTCGKKVDFSFRSCWIIGLRFLLSNSLERRQGSWRWKSLTDIKELQKCEILVSILVRHISVLPAGKKKKWEKLRQFSDVFARTSIVSTHRTHLHQSANNPTRASMLRASEAKARERRRKVMIPLLYLY